MGTCWGATAAAARLKRPRSAYRTDGWQLTLAPRAADKCRPLIVGIVLLAFPIAGAAQPTPAGSPTPACDALQKSLNLPAVPPIRRLDCRIENGCIRVDWNIVQEQHIEKALGL